MITPFKLHQEIINIIGNYGIIKNYREGSKRTGVWEIQCKSDLKKYFVKSFTRKNRWHPEVFAYKNWIPEILPYAPELIGVIDQDDLYAIIISSLEGITLREAVGLSENQISNAYYKAGELTKILHKKFSGDYFGRPDCNGNPIEIFSHSDPVYYLNHSIIEALEKGKELNCFENREIQLGEWVLKNTHLFQDCVPRAVSWDSSPNNWVVDERTGEFLGFIDFENMLWGFEVDNFTMMYERYFPNFPKGKEAFFKGYGLEALEEKSQQIKIACIKAGLCNVVWGQIFNDERSVSLARKMLSMINI